MLSSDWVLPIEVVNFLKKQGSVFALMPSRSKFIGGIRCFAFESRSDDTFGWASYRGKKIRSGLSTRTIKSHLNEEFFCFMNVSEVYLPTFIQNRDLVKNLELLAIC